MVDDYSGWTLVARISYARNAGEETNRSNLSNISKALTEKGIQHRLEPRPDGVALWIEQKKQVAEAIQLLEQLKVSSQNQLGVDINRLGDRVVKFSLEYPAVAVSIALSMLGALLVSFRFDLVNHFTFQDFVVVGDKIGFYPVSDAFQKGQYWRLMTPAFLHFGIFHLAFNSLWIWELGRRIETLCGSRYLLIFILFSGVAANLTQYYWSGPSLFGGMSGVVYGLLGYIWVRHRLSPHSLLAVPPGLIVFMLVWLVIGMTGVLNLFISGNIANAAHVGGLIAGIAAGWWAGRVR